MKAFLFPGWTKVIGKQPNGNHIFFTHYYDKACYCGQEKTYVGDVISGEWFSTTDYNTDPNIQAEKHYNKFYNKKGKK